MKLLCSTAVGESAIGDVSIRMDDGLIYSLQELDRAAHRRADAKWLKDQLATSAKLVPVWQGQNLFRLGGGPILRESAGLASSGDLIFLGLQKDGGALFASHLATPDSETDALGRLELTMEEARFIHLRQFVGSLSPAERSILFYARALCNWHADQRFCNRCGARTEAEEAGHVMSCVQCGVKHFPRSDPATIMLVHREEHCLLGRQPAWPEGMFSTLAGFVEAGESAEDAVAREVYEESGIRIKDIRYFASQPWPFPQSLMLGFFATATSAEIIRGAELADVRWFSIEETRALLARLASRFPHLDTIARRLIRHWLTSHGAAEP